MNLNFCILCIYCIVNMAIQDEDDKEDEAKEKEKETQMRKQKDQETVKVAIAAANGDLVTVSYPSDIFYSNCAAFAVLSFIDFRSVYDHAEVRPLSLCVHQVGTSSIAQEHAQAEVAKRAGLAGSCRTKPFFDQNKKIRLI